MAKLLAPDGTFCVVLPAAVEEAFLGRALSFQLSVCKRLLVNAREGGAADGSGTARVLLAFRLGQNDVRRTEKSSQHDGYKSRGDSGQMSVRREVGNQYSADYISLTRQFYAVPLDARPEPGSCDKGQSQQDEASRCAAALAGEGKTDGSHR